MICRDSGEFGFSGQFPVLAIVFLVRCRNLGMFKQIPRQRFMVPLFYLLIGCWGAQHVILCFLKYGPFGVDFRVHGSGMHPLKV